MQPRSKWSTLWTGAMLLIAVGLALYFAIYVCNRVGKPHQLTATILMDNSTGDWAYYDAAASEIGHGGDIYSVIAYQRADRGPGYIYPPLLAFLYQPLAALAPPPDLPGARISVIIDILAMAGALAVAARALLQRLGARFDWEAVLTVAVLAALLSTDKLKGEFQMLQCNGLVALGMALGLWLLDVNPLLAGLAIGFAINIKYQALGLVAYLLFRRRWKTLGFTALGTAFWALLPALSVGLARDWDYLQRGFSGVLRLVGFHTSDNVAQIMPLSAPESTSITSAAARFTESHGLHTSPFVFAGTVALLWLVALFLIYRARGVPALAWPAAAKQRLQPWLAAIGADWMAVIASVLAFSPETNSRHLVQTALINVLGVVLVFRANGTQRLIAVVGIALMWAGLSLPPGNFNDPHSAVHAWHGIGGPTWCTLLGAGCFVWCALGVAKSAPVSAATTEMSAGAQPA